MSRLQKSLKCTESSLLLLSQRCSDGVEVGVLSAQTQTGCSQDSFGWGGGPEALQRG